MTYELEVYTLDTSTGTYTRLGEITNFADLEWNQKSNKPSTMQFSLNIYSKDTIFIQPFKNWILLKRDGSPYLFQITNVRGGLQSDSGRLVVYCTDILYALNQIYVEGSFVRTNTDAGVIAIALIDIAQAKDYGNYGIQTGTVETIGNTNETLYYQSIGKALTNQADNIVGYYFMFTPVLDANQILDYVRFDCFKSAGVFRDNLPPLELGYAVNIVDFAMAEEVYNKIYTLGTGTGDVLVAPSSSTGSQAIFGLREIVNKEASISVRSTLQEKGDQFLLNSQGVKLELGFQLTTDQTPYYGQFGLLDTLKVNIQIAQTFFNFQGTVQIKEIIFNYDYQTNKEIITPIIEYYK